MAPSDPGWFMHCLYQHFLAGHRGLRVSLDYRNGLPSALGRCVCLPFETLGSRTKGRLQVGRASYKLLGKYENCSKKALGYATLADSFHSRLSRAQKKPAVTSVSLSRMDIPVICSKTL